MSSGNSKLALELNKPNLISGTIETKTYWLADSSEMPNPIKREISFLPAYDEFLISYRARTASLFSVDNKKTISDNGIFYPTILEGGQIIGTWKRNCKGNHIILTINPFKIGDPDNGKIYRKSISRYSKFYNKETEIVIPPD